MPKFQISILKKQKVLFLKKDMAKIDPKDGVSGPNFSEGFALSYIWDKQEKNPPRFSEL